MIDLIAFIIWLVTPAGVIMGIVMMTRRFARALNNELNETKAIVYRQKAELDEKTDEIFALKERVFVLEQNGTARSRRDK